MIAGGIDTHKDFHILAIVDKLGRELAHHRIEANPKGYAHAARILGQAGNVVVIGIEGAGSYGAAVSRYLQKKGYRVSEVCRPKRPRRRPGEHKSDPADALRAARDALRDLDLGRSIKTQNGSAESARVLACAHRSAVKTRIATMNAIKGLIVSAPDVIRESLRTLKDKDLIDKCSSKRTCADQIVSATWTALFSLAQIWKQSDKQARLLEKQMEELLKTYAPALLETFGVGPVSGCTLLAVAGDNPERFRKGESSFAAVCGASPVDASSGGPNKRYRLNPGGDRQANAALHTIAIVRMKYDDETKAYVERRTSEGKNKREIIRCLKRSIAREIYKVIKDPLGQVRKPRQKRA